MAAKCSVAPGEAYALQVHIEVDEKKKITDQAVLACSKNFVVFVKGRFATSPYFAFI